MPSGLADHTADVGLRIEAPTLPALFEEAARALTALLVEEPEAVVPREAIRVALEADDPADLLVDWLHALLVAFELRRLVFARFEVELCDGALGAVATGEAFDPARHRVAHEVKAITYHRRSLRQGPAGWVAEVVVDV